MSLDISSRTVAAPPALRPLLDRVSEALEANSDDEVIDPAILARRAGLTDIELLAVLNLLRKNNLGRLEVAVVNSHGLALAFYPDAHAVDDLISYDSGKVGRPQPEDIHVVFRLRRRSDVGMR